MFWVTKNIDNGVALGEVRAAANDRRRCQSVIPADQWEAEPHVLLPWAGQGMVIYVRDHSDMVGTRHVRIDWFGGQRLANIARI